MTETTPTRDEAVRDVLAQTERRENGLRANMDEVATLAHQMISIIRRGALRPDPKTGWLDSAPAPASGGVDAVAWRTVSDFVDEMLRDWAGGDDCRMGFGLNGATVTKGQFRAVQAALASLSPAATPVSEAGGEPDMRRVCEALGFDPTNHHNAAKCPYCNPDQADAPKLTYRSTQATTCASCGEHKHTPLRRDEMGGYVCLTCIDKRLAALAKPASSPAGGDVVREAAQRVIAEGRIASGGIRRPAKWIQVPGETWSRLQAALSQSTSAGRVGE